MEAFIKGILIIGYGFLQAWVLMVALGMIASWILLPGLAIGFWATMVVSSMLSIGFSGEFAREIQKQKF